MAVQKWRQWVENEDSLAVLCAWKRAGISDEEIAKKIGVSRSTLSEWKRKYEPIRKALESGREFADRLVENSLFKMTQGYSVEVRKTFKVKTVEYEDGKRVSEKEELRTGTDTEYIKPDVKAIIFYLQNRKPEEWQKKVDVQEDENRGGVVVLTPVELEEMRGVIQEDGKPGKHSVGSAAEAADDDVPAGV